MTQWRECSRPGIVRGLASPFIAQTACVLPSWGRDGLFHACTRLGPPPLLATSSMRQPQRGDGQVIVVCHGYGWSGTCAYERIFLSVTSKTRAASPGISGAARKTSGAGAGRVLWLQFRSIKDTPEAR